MDEKRIQQVLEIEKQAQEIRAAAEREAGQLPALAEQEAQALIDEARRKAGEEARRLVSEAHKSQESTQLLSEAEAKNREIEKLAVSNMERAVNFVLERVIGRG